MSSSGRLLPLSLVLATASLLVASYAVMSPSPAAKSSECACDTQALEATIATLTRRVEVAERTAARGTVRRVADAAMEPERASPGEAPPPLPEMDAADAEGAPDGEVTTPRFVEFEVPEPGVSLSQSESGALSVRNTDPALVGKVLIVQARGEDGQMRDLPITVPPAQ